MNNKVKPFCFWFTSGRSLIEIGNTLLVHGIICDVAYDHENVYEWIEAQTNNVALDLNIARKHKEGTGIAHEPITVRLMYAHNEPSDTLVEKIAMSFAKRLNTEVSLGTVDYVGGDDYRYNEQRKITG